MPRFLTACVACFAAAAGALDGTIQIERGEPLPGAAAVLMDTGFTRVIGMSASDAKGVFHVADPGEAAYLVVQPAPKPNGTGDFVYPYQPRIYAVSKDDTKLNLRLPEAFGLVIEAYDASGSLLNWQDFKKLGVSGGQFLNATNLNDETIMASVWPVHGPRTKTTPPDPREKALPGVFVSPGQPVCVDVLFWPTAYGKLMLRADNAGQGFTGDKAGDSRVLVLNHELARTALGDLERRKDLYDDDARGVIAALASDLKKAGGMGGNAAIAKASDEILAKALELRDALELQRAKKAAPALRQGTLRVKLSGLSEAELKTTKIAIKPIAQDFLFGVYEGSERVTDNVTQLAKDGFNFGLGLLAWNWTQDVNEKAAWIDKRFGFSALGKVGVAMKVHGAVWLQGSNDGKDDVIDILPEKAYGMSHAELAAAALEHQKALIEAMGDRVSIWEAVNEPATTNVVNLTRDEMFGLLRGAAGQIRAAKKVSLINSPHEFGYGGKYLIFAANGAPRDDFALTYSEFLAQAEKAGALAEVDILGLQCYPGYHLNSRDFAGQEGPAWTPSHLMDMIDRYGRFGRPLHVTEFTVPGEYGSDWVAGYWKDKWSPEAQAEYAEAVYTLLFADPNVQSITWWGSSDKGADVMSGGLLDEYGKDKPVLEKLRGLLAGWQTQETEIKPNEEGVAELPVFGGRYALKIDTPKGKRSQDDVAVWEQWTRTVEESFGETGKN